MHPEQNARLNATGKRLQMFHHFDGYSTVSVEKTPDISKYREIFKSAYTRAVMRGLPIREGILAGVQSVHSAVGCADRAQNILQDLRARLGDVLGDGQ